jgi:hypothetical protein
MTGWEVLRHWIEFSEFFEKIFSWANHSKTENHFIQTCSSAYPPLRSWEYWQR